METNDPWLADLVRRADAGERIDPDAMDFSQPPDIINDDATQERIETLAEIICRGGDEPAAALLLLMATLENDAHPKALLFLQLNCGRVKIERATSLCGPPVRTN